MFFGLPKACGKFWQTAYIHIFCIWQKIICIHFSLESIFKVDMSLLFSTIWQCSVQKLLKIKKPSQTIRLLKSKPAISNLCDFSLEQKNYLVYFCIDRKLILSSQADAHFTFLKKQKNFEINEHAFQLFWYK